VQLIAVKRPRTLPPKDRVICQESTIYKRFVTRAAAAISTSLLLAVFALDPSRLLAANDCLDHANLMTGQSEHWYYRVDRMSGRKCWYRVLEITTLPQQPSPRAARLPFSSLFASLDAMSATRSISQSDSVEGDIRGIRLGKPQAPRSNEPVPTLWHQAAAKPFAAVKSRASRLPDQRDRDALFQHYLRWREQQLQQPFPQ
jgi:hypothetical protein